MAADAGSSVTAFEPDYFASAQPVSALDIVKLVPGFRLEEGDSELRGYSGAGGNVLVDGQRPTSKEDTLEDVLKRIPAGSVERIELIRSGAGYDMQGYTLLANVVRSHTQSLSGRIEGTYANYRHGYDAPRLAGELRHVAGGHILDLSGAIYRDIDDEHGFGSRNRYAEDGTPVRLGVYGQPEGDNIREVLGSYQLPLAGGTARVNGLYKMKKMFANIGEEVIFPTPYDASGTERVNTESTEIGFHYDRAVGARSQIELLALRRTTGINGTDKSFAPSGDDVTRESSDASETILRGVLRRKAGNVSLEGGIEGALNILDSHSALEEDGVDIPLPAANVRIEEKRAEAFFTAAWHLSSALTVEAGSRYETSRLTQSGDSALRKSLSFIKPRLLVRWAPSPQDEIRALFERSVGQLDFADFVSSASLTGGTVTAGNKDLEPDSLWRSELAWEHRIGKGSVVVTARHEAISDVVDRIPVFTDEGVYDAVGNIGSGRRQEVQFDFNLPFDPLGLAGVTLQGSGLWRHSRVTDPVTGERRRISEDLPIEAKVSLTHDIARWHTRWGINYVHAEKETTFKIDEVEIDRVPDRVDAFIEYKPDAAWTLRAFAKNLTNSPVIRTRSLYTGLRGLSPIRHIERRELNSGPYVGFTIQRTFGG
ncbi:TonB-dependent receptor domain-containing protein [Sphingosinicella xenopeptidilytica]|uniref:TonB-dependent receptor domain-containing protein n=1 Tax=Sphingosinicella xenopeptidilytica TaxID=364098 RepID=A0ABW3C4M0_SPHXN